MGISSDCLTATIPEDQKVMFKMEDTEWNTSLILFHQEPPTLEKDEAKPCGDPVVKTEPKDCAQGGSSTKVTSPDRTEHYSEPGGRSSCGFEGRKTFIKLEPPDKIDESTQLPDCLEPKLHLTQTSSPHNASPKPTCVEIKQEVKIEDSVQESKFGLKLQEISSESKPTPEVGNYLEAVPPSSMGLSSVGHSLPTSVTNTLNFTLRQTGMPVVSLPQEASLIGFPCQVTQATTTVIQIASSGQQLLLHQKQSSPPSVGSPNMSSASGASTIPISLEQPLSRTETKLLEPSVLLQASSNIMNTVTVKTDLCDGGAVKVGLEKGNSAESVSNQSVGLTEVSSNKIESPKPAVENMLSVKVKQEPCDMDMVPTVISENCEIDGLHMPSSNPPAGQDSDDHKRALNDGETGSQLCLWQGITSALVLENGKLSEQCESLCPVAASHRQPNSSPRPDFYSITAQKIVQKENSQDIQTFDGENHNSLCQTGSHTEDPVTDYKSAEEEPHPESAEGIRQNVLLKQLLQNCPSAETQKKGDEFQELISSENGKHTASEQVGPVPSVLKERDKPEEAKKKPSYLDIRRAQLEKEPTPPPEEIKTKRRRPKKKKEGKEGQPPKKRQRKASASKAEEDLEVFMESVIIRLRALPSVRILEPKIKPNLNVCPVFGTGDMNCKESPLRGTYGNALPPNQPDFYSTYPFGSNPPTPPSSLPPTPPPIRSFYNLEFAATPTTTINVKEPSSKKVDVPASLPTPPPHVDHQRYTRDTDSPDTIISSSSPECILAESPIKFLGLRLIDDENNIPEGRMICSPTVSLVAPIPIRAVPIACKNFSPEFDDDKDKENSIVKEHRLDLLALKTKMASLGGGPQPLPLKDSGNVAVTLTLTSAAVEDIRGVLSALANILKIPSPTVYEIVERTATPPSQKLGLYKKAKDNHMNIQSILNGKPRFCRHCDIVVLSAGIRKKASELPYISKEDLDGDDVTFCSTNCYMQFALSHRSTPSEKKDSAATMVSHPNERSNVVPSDMDRDQDAETTQDEISRTEHEKLGEVRDEISLEKSCEHLHGILAEETMMSPPSKLTDKEPGTPPYCSEAATPEDVHHGLGQALSTSPAADEEGKPNTEQGRKRQPENDEHLDKEPVSKKCRDVRWKFWTASFARVSKYKPVSEEEIGQLLSQLKICVHPEKMPPDLRRCVLCRDSGDGKTNGAARLLNMDVDKWVHLNCALWSAEVYETVNGALINVDVACKRAMALSCCKCHKTGASLKCFKIRCPNTYHFPCAVRDSCMFLKDKTMFCPQHLSKVLNPENELQSVAVFRRVYVNRDEHKQVASMIHQGEQNLLRVGSLIFLNIGQLLPHQLPNFHSANSIYPVGYKVVRMYWSMHRLQKRCQYICSIHELDGKPEFHIHVKDPGYAEVHLVDSTPRGVWKKVLEPIEKARRESNSIKVFPSFITGEDLFGLIEPAVLRILESLPGIDSLSNYNFKFGRSPLLELPLAINPTGCARTEPKLRTHFKRSHTLHTSNTSRSSLQSTFGGVEVSSPYTKQFVHSKSSQYRKMKTEWRNNVYLARSRIQGLGLYAARDIEKHTMVIEYIGQLIRNEIAERNEAIYETQNRGVYMFRLDENRVIDATLCGGLARYMNHSCNPNCVAEVVQIDRENKILIIANRRISRGEELTYDYKFEVEDDQHKIPCLCRAPNCRKWMN